MRLTLTALLALGLSSTTFAGDWDFSSATAARSYPVGLILVGEAGYGQLLWGERGTPESPRFLYGYIRPAVAARTIGVVNGASASLTVAPISILTGGVRWGTSARLVDTPAFDCTVLHCRGSLSRTQLFGSLRLGYGVWGMALDVISESVRSAGSPLPFVDDTSTLVGNPGRDRQVAIELFNAFTITPNWKVILWLRNQEMLGSGNMSQLRSLMLQRQNREWTATLGAGLYQSSHQAPGPSFFTALRWTPLPSLAL